ncbi:MAG: transcriptional regulator [Verrucomicrobiales bacterium]|nr:transcriptional regulator [Verrucomicrobiales bacterium]
MTQEALAEKVGLNPRTVQKIEAGSLNLLVTTVTRLKRALGVDWDELLPK